MSNDVNRVASVFFLTLTFAPAMAHAQFGGGAGGAFPGAGFGGGGWRAGGGIAGGGWHGGGAPGAGFLPGMGAAPGFGFGGMTGNPGWQGNGGLLPGQTIPGAGNAWSNAHPYSWYNGPWHNHTYGNGFAGYTSYPRLPSLSAVLTSSSAPANAWDRFGSGSGMGGYASANYPPAWGIGGWGQGSQWYNSGYVPYYNPYNDPAVTTTFNYGQPIPVPTGAELRDTDNPAVGLAIDRFRSGDYEKALSLVDMVIKIQPYDAAAHELRSLILFAMKDYPRAAETIHSVLATGPGWDWTTLSSVYSNMQLYQSQLAALENYVDSHPKKADARFLLAYHYISAGRTADAKKQLERVTALVPDDKLAAKLLRMVGDGAATQAAAPSPDVKPVDPKTLVGIWRAKRGDGSVFTLDLAPNKTYTWKCTRQGQFQTISGNYTLDKATLTLQGSNNGSMVAQVITDGVDRFRFKPLDGPADDPGLTFIKQQ